MRDERAVQRFYINRYVSLGDNGSAGSQPQQEGGEKRNKLGNSRMGAGPHVCRHLLEEMVGDASRLAAAVCFVSRFRKMLLAAVGADVVFHAKQAVGMVMVGKDGHCHHQQADDEQEKWDVSFALHAGQFLSAQR